VEGYAGRVTHNTLNLDVGENVVRIVVGPVPDATGERTAELSADDARRFAAAIAETADQLDAFVGEP